MSGRRIHLPSLSRGWKVVRNLLLTAVILVLFWGRLEYPMPSRELAFRRAEQAPGWDRHSSRWWAATSGGRWAPARTRC